MHVVCVCVCVCVLLCVCVCVCVCDCVCVCVCVFQCNSTWLHAFMKVWYVLSISIASISVGIFIQFYSDGVMDVPNCSRSKLTHAMTIIGYGSGRSKDYWLLKNR